MDKVRMPKLAVLLAAVLAGAASTPVRAGPDDSEDADLATRAASWFESMPPLTRHYPELNQTAVAARTARDIGHAAMLREKLENRWFAALVAMSGAEPFSIHGRFETWRGLVEFLAGQDALVEVWASSTEGQGGARRIPAPELARLKAGRHEPPTRVTVTYREEWTGAVIRCGLEFGFGAADAVAGLHVAYQRHRVLQLNAREILGARNAEGLPDAFAQWVALQAARRDGRFVPLEPIGEPWDARDLFVACEYEVDAGNNFRSVVRLYRHHEIRRHIVGERQALSLEPAEQIGGRTVLAFQGRGVSDELEPVFHPLPGLTTVELRVEDRGRPDPRTWNVLEFGEPELLRQTALAHFSLINAHLETRRKALAMKQANLALVVEPIIAGLNIGGGVAGISFPLGAAARLGYNALLVPRLIPDVPSARQMRELLRLAAARADHPELRARPGRLLDRHDLKVLREGLAELTEADVSDFIQLMGEEDLEAMLRIARLQRIDAKLVNLLGIVAEAGRVSGWTDEAGWQRDVFNNIYFSVTGELSINYIIASLAGQRDATPLSGVSLEALSRGDGPAEAWLQYVNITVDLRAVLNTVVRLSQRGLASKELKRPFPYAPRMSDLAAYEFRIFGYPLLLFHKRGLIRADAEAFQNDYAYSLLGTRIVERFRTREEFEREIRDGRVVPLGYVRVPTAAGGWKETNLAVFAHRIPAGRHRGKTALVLYGLKAFHEHSEMVERERRRFLEFERGLLDGAVIEQCIEAEPEPGQETAPVFPGRLDPAGLTSGQESVLRQTLRRRIEELDLGAGGAREPVPPARMFEPMIHAGRTSAAEIYEPLLGDLLELRRHEVRKSWGIQIDDQERDAARGIREGLAARGIAVSPGDPLESVDAFHSSFLYRRSVDGWRQRVRVARLPGLADIQREIEKADDAKRIEAIRRDAAAGRTDGVILLHDAIEVAGRLEPGPLRQDHEGRVFGAGVSSGARAMADLFDLIDGLPVIERARLQYNHFAATPIDLDLEGNGCPETVFLTIEFPAGEVRREWTNPLSGEREILVFVDGQWRETITDRRIVLLEYDDAKIETRTRVHRNLGNRFASAVGELLEETRTTEVWHRDLSRPDLDPYLPAICKVRFHHVTGVTTREIYGLFPLPIEVIDGFHVTRSRYTPHGRFESARIFENGRSATDFARPTLERVLDPTLGRERFRLRSTGPELGGRRDASVGEYQTRIERTDLIKGSVRIDTVEDARSGRKISERYVDPFDGTRSFATTVWFEYDDDFQHGLIPVRTVTVSEPSQVELSETTSLHYDPWTQRMSVVETDHTGRSRTNTWDPRWSSPVETDTALRRTVREFSRDETTVHGATTVRASGETIETFAGQYDPADQTVQVTREIWHRPGILTRVETDLYSAFGKRISTRVGDTFRVIVQYTDDGREQARRIFRPDPATGRFDRLHREEDDYHWERGERSARVRTWLDGAPHVEYRTRSDAEGRLTEDDIRSDPRIELRTLLTYDGGTDRILEAVRLQNGRIRTVHRTLGEIVRPDGSHGLRIEVRPYWGLTSTNTYPLGDPFGRPITIEFENGDRAVGLEWFDGTAIARVAELHDRHGRPRERVVRHPNAGHLDGLAYDRMLRSRLSPWGQAALMEDLALIPGTDIALFQTQAEGRIRFDLSVSYMAPSWAEDLGGERGLPVVVAGSMRSNVTALFRHHFREWQDPGIDAPPERVMEALRIDLAGLFHHKWSRRISDRTGALIEEQIGTIATFGARDYSEEALFAELAAAATVRTFTSQYDAGWLVEEVEPDQGVSRLGFGHRLPVSEARVWSVNNTGWREWPTGVNGFQRADDDLFDVAESDSYCFRRLRKPRIVRDNPHLPGVTNVWSAWTSAELDDTGRVLFETELFLDARGDTLVSRAAKHNSRGRPAVNIAYGMPTPAPESWPLMAVVDGERGHRLNPEGPVDLSSADFIGFYLDTDNRTTVRVHLRLRDSRGGEISVTEGLHVNRDHPVVFWPVNSGRVQWLPDDRLPERGAVITAPPSWVDRNRVFVVSVPELAQGGLDVRQLTRIECRVAVSEEGEPIRISPLYRLVHAGPWLPRGTGPRSVDRREFHSSGLETLTMTQPSLGRGIPWSRASRKVLVRHQGILIATIDPSFERPFFPVLRFADHTDPDRPRPLYALAADDGRFLEYYRTVHSGDARVYTVAGGFTSPKLEVFRAALLDDELAPGLLAFGRDYDITLDLSRGAGRFSTTLANLRNRSVASIFSLAAQRVMEPWGQSRLRPTRTPPVAGVIDAATQAATIDQLPMLAQALLSGRASPWADTPTEIAPPMELGIDTNAWRLRLRRLATRYPETGLIPTALDTPVERFVDTIEQGAIIELAVNLDELGLARDLLAFYWEMSEGGSQRLLASYDAKTGASLIRETRYERPSDARATAGAQLAIAQAAFHFGAASGDPHALEFGVKLVRLLLTTFRPPLQDVGWPRGIAEHSARGPVTRRGLTFWPEARVFSLKTNAGAYLLFTRIEELLDRHALDVESRQMIRHAVLEQAAWLTQRILPHVEQSGVVPKGLLEIQDVHGNSSALAAERWTAAEDWLAFLEAADRMGLDRGQARLWLDHLAQVHGVTVSEIWGLDSTVALDRPDAISPALTARFLRIAARLEHTQAVVWARRNLERMREGDSWSALITTAAPEQPLPTGQGRAVHPVTRRHEADDASSAWTGWPETMGVAYEFLGAEWSVRRPAGARLEPAPIDARDFTEFLWTVAAFYLATVVIALFWWAFSAIRKSRRSDLAASGALVSDAVLRRAEERWAKRVLGLRVPAGSKRSRYSNGAMEQNFHMQLRAAYKLVLEWRRIVGGWTEDDERLVEDGSDEWLNGMDEFVVMVGVYSRWVVKAGRKDGRPKSDVLEGNEDSNHLWSRLVMYFAESHIALLAAIKEFKSNPRAATFLGLDDQIGLILRTMGVRARSKPLDGRVSFDVPDREAAFDLLMVQLPGATLAGIAAGLEEKLDIPRGHLVSFVKGFKSFKEREHLYPVHPYLFDLAKVLPHFLLMGLAGLIWYNHDLGGLKIYPYLKELAVGLVLDWPSFLVWAVPLAAGAALSLAAYTLEIYRYRWRARSPAKPGIALDADLSSLFGEETRTATPAIRLGRGWDPVRYRYAGWILRALGLAMLVIMLLRIEPPSFATFMFVKGLLAVLLIVEAGAILLPIVVSHLSMWFQDRATTTANPGWITRFVNQLNLVPTRPVSVFWLSVRYHFQPSLPSGGALSMTRAILFYLAFGAAFFFVGGYMFRQALEVWFQETYFLGRDLGLVAGGFLFWNTMYLLRFGLFVLFVTVASAVARFPFRVAVALAAIAGLASIWFGPSMTGGPGSVSILTWGFVAVGLVLMGFEPEVLGWLRRLPLCRLQIERRSARVRQALDRFRQDPDRALGVVYMSGDDLSYLKLSPGLLTGRLRVLRDQLDSGGLRLLCKMHRLPQDDSLERDFGSLYELEQKHDVTLWHPCQLVLDGESSGFLTGCGLTLTVEDEAHRERLLAAWHMRRWLVTMMSTAGHAQDTAINLVDIALRLAEAGLGARTVFYLIQNKYDNSDNNRPSQLRYDRGELGQRDKLAQLLEQAAPGSRAYNLNDWTPFGFKAGGMVGMDLVYEESLRLTHMLILDRNANAHDLDALLTDLEVALSDPGVVIVIPGRSTTNTLTPLGQGSQLIEEGQRALTRGVMELGGTGGESLGTGWGNIQAVYYGRVQRALCDPDTPVMPLTTSGQRGVPFGDRFEGLVGFGPHAVGISEDIWSVTQAAHNALALGCQIKFRRSEALWHKVRESWSHAEWFSAFPRWAGGYLQMLLDPMMQRINDDGPLSVFAKEIRANGGRFFLSAPAALLSILLMPLAIIWDVSPFVQILILLWNLGFVMNQVLTGLGLVASLESTGFNRATAGAGVILAGLLAWIVEGWSPFAPSLLILGCVVGGFAVGLGRWLYDRGRDIILFGPQLVIHALGQVVRQSLEFVLSGASANDAQAVNIPFRAWAGPREDRPAEGYQNVVNLRTVVWGVGLVALGLNLFALAQLDFLNVLLLLPSLMFSVSALVGPFLMHPKPGRHLRGWAWIPKLLGWTACFACYCLGAWLIGQGGWPARAGLLLLAACFICVARTGLRYLGYPTRLKRATRQLAGRITMAGLDPSTAAELANRIVRGFSGDVEKSKAALLDRGVAPDGAGEAVEWIENRVVPLLRRPMLDLRRGRWANSRLVSEFSRSFALALFTFLWFFIVPVPGLLVFFAPGDYRVTVSLGTLLALGGGILGLILAGWCASLLLEWVDRCGFTRRGLVPLIEEQWWRFQALVRSPGRLTALQTASLYALFTDAQTHFDQRGYACARRTLELIRRILDAVPRPLI
jgi:hypothetical protein